MRARLSLLTDVPAPADLASLLSKAEGLPYKLADAAVAADGASSTAGDGAAAVQKSGGWFGFISDTMEVVLKVESTLAKQNLQPKIEAIRQRYAGIRREYNSRLRVRIDRQRVSRFTNNLLSTAQQVWLRKLGGAKSVVHENACGIITAGCAKRSASQPGQTGDRFRELKQEERRKTVGKV